MEKLWAFIAALLVGLLVALAGYFLNLSATRKERKEKAEEQLKNAARSILVELEANMRFANQPFSGVMLPFTTEIWDDNKGVISALPEKVQTAIYEAYIAGWELNAIVRSNLTLPYGSGYYDNSYKQKCSEILDKAKIAIELLRGWLKKPKV
jgi:hypothetical protein